jgi:hypothetical protein
MTLSQERLPNLSRRDEPWIVSLSQKDVKESGCMSQASVQQFDHVISYNFVMIDTGAPVHYKTLFEFAE